MHEKAENTAKKDVKPLHCPLNRGECREDCYFLSSDLDTPAAICAFYEMVLSIIKIANVLELSRLERG